MTSDRDRSQQDSFAKVALRFFGGVALGALMLLVPATYVEFDEFGLVQGGVAFVLVVACGLLSLLWGEKFANAVTQMLERTGL